MFDKNNKKRASTLVYIMSLLVVFLAFVAFAVDGTITFTNRVKLQKITEQAVLTAASEFNYSSSVTIADIQSAAQSAFNIFKQDGLQTATIDSIDVTFSSDKDKVKISTTFISQPLFLSYLGVSGVTLRAKACAVSEKLNVKSYYSGANWVTTSAAYFSDILSKNLNLNDTAILLPQGKFSSASYDLASGNVKFDLIDGADDKPLSLGPGGFITMKLPAPIIDKPGADLYINEKGSLEGYLVFAGLDNDPTSPYVNVDKPGAGISWVNISCSGTSDYSGLGANAHQTASIALSHPDKFYGSGNFDIGNSCTGGISMAKYIRIVDDNSESAFVTTDNTNYYKAMLYGEASSATPGADIDEVQVLNHVRLEPSS